MMVLRVYRVDCYLHLLFSGFPRTFIYGVAYQPTLLFMTGQLKRKLEV